jgi:S-DNA-T family DNA segregation ATPase FtsK/SpoIIIE
MARKWVEKITVKKRGQRGERMPWITKQTISVPEDASRSVIPREIPLYPEVRLVEMPDIPARNVVDIQENNPSNEDDYQPFNLREITRGLIEHDEGGLSGYHGMIPVSRDESPDGITANRIHSIERERLIESAIPIASVVRIDHTARGPAVHVRTILPVYKSDNCESGTLVSHFEETLRMREHRKDDAVQSYEKSTEAPCRVDVPDHDPYRDIITAEEDDDGMVEDMDKAAETVGGDDGEDDDNIDELVQMPVPKAASSMDSPQKVFAYIPINEEYIIPVKTLQISPKHDHESWKTEIRRNSELLVKTLNDFGIESRVSMVNRGPVVTLYEMQLAPGIKVTRVVSLADDIALALAASRVRVVAPIPGKSAIGIEVPNSLREMVTLGDIVGTKEYASADMMLKIAMGKDILGKPVMIDLKKQPHLLIAGATGAGKSVCVNGVIVSLICNYDPNYVRFIMIDPKMVELQLYNGLPHLLTPVITDPDDAPKALKWAIIEMERRYRLLSDQCTRDIDRYNQKIASMKHPEEFERLPYIIIIIDEFADLMMVAPKEVENYVTRIAQKARAVGIHLVLATQRPSVDIITGIIKANFPARVAFQVAQKTDSRTIIDQNGAEKLLGRGDMLYQSPMSSFPVRIQGAYLSEDEILAIVQRACKFARPRYIDFDEFLKAESVAEDESGDVNDEMFADALKIVSDSKKASASYLQRRLSIGYNRAARIVERMEELGYVGPPQGSKPREVYV